MKKMVSGVLILFFFVSVPGIHSASPRQEAEKSRQKETEKEKKRDREKKSSLIGNFWRDNGRIWTSPFRISGTQWLVWGGVALVTGVMIANDESIYRNIKDYQNDHQWVDDISPFFCRLCEGYPFPIAGAFLLGGWVFKDKKMVETGSLAIQAMLHSFLVVQTVKHLTGRQRPSWDEGKDDWAGPVGFFKRYEAGQWARYDAFFSGHTVTIWSLATVIAHQYRKSWLVPALCYSTAMLGGLATITEDLHWISDVFLGAVVGYAIGRFVVKRRSKHWVVAPVAHSQGLGIGINYVF